jgi:choice-of-anchor B domain-containing protein
VAQISNPFHFLQMLNRSFTLNFLLLAGILLLAAKPSFAQNALNITKLYQFDDNSLPIANPGGLSVQFSGCWGLTVNGREVAVLGGALHVLFFDVTNPNDVQMVGMFEGQTTTIWREFKSYKNRVYGVSDNTSEGMMIFDLSNYPASPITRDYFSNALFNNAHTITLDTLSGRIYLNGSNVNDMLVLSVQDNPEEPVLVGQSFLEGGYVHDSYIRQDTLYCSHGYGGYFVYNMANADAPVTLASINPAGSFYNHNSWLSSDGKYSFMTEEIPYGRPVKVVDLQKLNQNDIEVVHTFLDSLTMNGNNPTPHNVYIKDNLLFNSQYEDGLLVYDITDPLQPLLVAYYDTHPENTTYTGYFGNWGNYPWLPSGNIIAGDMQNGFFLLKMSLPVSTHAPDNALQMEVMPNPASDFLYLSVRSAAATMDYMLFNQTGQLVKQEYQLPTGTLRLDTQGLAAGVYFMQVRSGKELATKKVVLR